MIGLEQEPGTRSIIYTCNHLHLDSRPGRMHNPNFRGLEKF